MMLLFIASQGSEGTVPPAGHEPVYRRAAGLGLHVRERHALH